MNRTVLVTGANRGIGLAIVGALAELGHSLFLGSRDLKAGEKAAGPFCRQGLDVTPIQVDHQRVFPGPKGDSLVMRLKGIPCSISP